MGCINSRKSGFKDDSAFRVRATRINPETLPRNGYLELNVRELIFAAPSSTPTVWALQHLRRFGLNGDIFSFEAGRRCMTGPGIYTFRCHRADQFYELFQQYINAVAFITDEIFGYGERDREHPSLIVGQQDFGANNYLEPAPLIANTMQANITSTENDELDFLDLSTNILLTNEGQVIQSNLSTPSWDIANASNVYFEHPIRPQLENNNNIETLMLTNVNANSAVTASSAINDSVKSFCQGLAEEPRLDLPPNERAPLPLTPSNEAKHMYANVNVPTTFCNDWEHYQVLSTKSFARSSTNPCYENLSPVDLTQLRSPPPISVPNTSDATQIKLSNVGQTNLLEQPPLTSGVNYIVLDLHQPGNSTARSGSGFSLESTIERLDADDLSAEVKSLPAVPVTITATSSKKTESTASGEHHLNDLKTENSLGYSTIDFKKTCALIKSSVEGPDFDLCHDDGESRITRHSKCVRKAYSISE